MGKGLERGPAQAPERSQGRGGYGATAASGVPMSTAGRSRGADDTYGCVGRAL